jgi:small subunit ribosomal protein S21
VVYDEGKAGRRFRLDPPIESEVNRLAEVVVQDGETVESALRRFKRKVQQEDIIKEIKRHSYYLKPGEKKRAKQALARKRNRKRQAKMIE